MPAAARARLARPRLVTDAAAASSCTGRRPARPPGPLDDTFYDLVEARFRRPCRARPRLRDLPRASTTRTTSSAIGSATRSSTRSQSERASPRRDRGARSGRHCRRGAIRARARAPQRPARALRRRGHRGLGAPRDRRLDDVGDALFLLFARDFAPLHERLDAIAGRLEAAPRTSLAHAPRAVEPQVRLWQRVELDRESRPARASSTRSSAAGSGVAAGDRRARRLDQAADGARKAAVAEYADWLRGTLAARHRRLAARARALRRAGRAARVRRPRRRRHPRDRLGAARAKPRRPRRPLPARSTPSATEADVVDRVKSDHPATFEAALEGYRDGDDPGAPAPHRPRHRRRSLPTSASRSSRRPSTCATSCRSRRTSSRRSSTPTPSGIYVVTPSVDGDPSAMREHNCASISNTSIHEAYPGHHLQLSVGGAPPVPDPPAGRRARVRRGLGHVLRADDARAGLRRRPRASA